MTQAYVLSSIFGMAKATINKTKQGYTLHIALTPKGSLKVAKYLTQSGHRRKIDALRSWEELATRLEVELQQLQVNHTGHCFSIPCHCNKKDCCPF
jgi:hypothetical protein